MPDKKIFAFPNLCTPSTPLLFDEELCIGCNACIDICQVDILIPNHEKGKPPLVLYPEECWYGGCCIEACPIPGAIKLNHPLPQRVRWKTKATNEHYRV